MLNSKLHVGAPFGLSHYIPLNGFHPLYRSLFEYIDENIKINSWDNVKLYQFIKQASGEEKRVFHQIINQEKVSFTNHFSEDVFSQKYLEHFWGPNLALTALLPGEIEFHHTAPYPSLKKPFIFHCESFIPIFLPFAGEGSDNLNYLVKLKGFYEAIFTSPKCLGIFSHLPETLQNISLFFKNRLIDEKLSLTRIGLTKISDATFLMSKRTAIDTPKFCFINSANQNPNNFFNRGGHLVLRFWKEFISRNKKGLLIIRSSKPEDRELEKRGVDIHFLNGELGKSIIWAETYFAQNEQNALIASCHFFLLPSMALHSVSIMQAMSLGLVCVVTDTIGTSNYLDESKGIILKGLREKLWHKEKIYGIELNHYNQDDKLEELLVTQMIDSILLLVKNENRFLEMSKRAFEHATLAFDGNAFCREFWDNIFSIKEKNHGLFKKYQIENDVFKMRLKASCIIEKDYSKFFESPTQPLRKLYTGKTVVHELTGMLVSAAGNPQYHSLHDWSPLSQLYPFDYVASKFTNNLEALNASYLNFKDSDNISFIKSLFILIARSFVRLLKKLYRIHPGIGNLIYQNLAILARYLGATHMARNVRRYIVSGYSHLENQTHLELSIIKFNLKDLKLQARKKLREMFRVIYKTMKTKKIMS